MATVGRKPKPTNLKLVTGNRGKRALPKNEAAVENAEPMSPSWLCDDAKVEWGRVCGQLFKVGLMTDLDRAALAAYCDSYGIFARSRRALEAMERECPGSSLTTMTTNGNVIQNPLIGIVNKAKIDMTRYAAEFGMTPSARSRVTPTEHGNGEKETGFSAFC